MLKLVFILWAHTYFLKTSVYDFNLIFEISIVKSHFTNSYTLTEELIDMANALIFPACPVRRYSWH